jgi:hypothetical protein
MKRFDGIVMTAACGMMGLGSCSQEVLNGYMSGDGQQHELRVMTRADVPVGEGMVYLMDATGACRARIETDDQGRYVTTSLPAGTYEAYAVGSDDLGSWVLPSQEEATADSEIRRAPDQFTTDLLMGHERIDLTEGQTTILDMELTHQVACVKEVTIRQVPDEVTGVKLTIEPVYDHVHLNGEFEDQEASCCEVTLSPATEAGTWYYDGGLFTLPSIGTPAITIVFQRGETTSQYRYTAEETVTSNHQVSISGTYTDIQVTDPPVAGGSWKDYYVVSINEEERIAVLLSRTQETGIRTALRMSERAHEISRPEGAITDAWRLPTEAECRTFLMATDIGSIDQNDDITTGSYYYQEDSQVGRIYLRIINGQKVLTPFVMNYYTDLVIYRPVIDVRW